MKAIKENFEKKLKRFVIQLEEMAKASSYAIHR
jgi:hypothetical protein